MGFAGVGVLPKRGRWGHPVQVTDAPLQKDPNVSELIEKQLGHDGASDLNGTMVVKDDGHLVVITGDCYGISMIFNDDTFHQCVFF